MKKTEEQKDEIRILSIQLIGALKFLKDEQGYSITSLLPRLSAAIQQKLAQPQISRFINCEEHFNDINVFILKRVVLALDKMIESEYKFSWNQAEKRYEVLKSANKETTDKNVAINEKPIGLDGNWICVTYNERETNRNKSDGVINHYFSFYKLKIFDTDRVNFQTSRTKFNGKLKAVNDARIALELVAKTRKMYLVGEIGLRDDYKELNTLVLAYADSGDTDIKCGLLICKRSNESFDDLETLRPVALADVKLLKKNEINLLIKKQITAPEI